MEYSSPLVALLGLAIVIVWSLDFWKVLKKVQLIQPTRNTKKLSKSLRFLTFVIGVSGWLLISYSMMGPRKALKYLPSNIEVNDIFLVVDVSRSMLAEDLYPNRLEVAKEKLREFAKLRPTDRIGVIAFSEKVFTALPLTVDPTLVDQILGEIRIGYLGSGTNIGDALALAVARGQDSKTKNKVIILLTDGVSNVGNMTPLEAAKIASSYNMKVYTIGLGGKSDAKIPAGNGMFGQRYQSIPGGSIDLKTLNEISDMTGGKSYMANTEGSLEEILNDIQKLEKTEINSQSQVVYDELYFKYLSLGLLLIFGSSILRRYFLKEIL